MLTFYKQIAPPRHYIDILKILFYFVGQASISSDKFYVFIVFRFTDFWSLLNGIYQIKLPRTLTIALRIQPLTPTKILILASFHLILRQRYLSFP